VVRYTIDTSFAVKGMVPPRRQKLDDILEKQQKMHKLARSYLDKVRDKHAEMYIPAVALIETAIVISRITNNEKDSRKGISFLRRNAVHMFYEHEILEEAISFGIESKASGYDTIFLTIAMITQSELLTDDSLQHKIALRRGIVSHLLRDMVEE
jgi:predicted nucleic acid-binding protein